MLSKYSGKGGGCCRLLGLSLGLLTDLIIVLCRRIGCLETNDPAPEVR